MKRRVKIRTKYTKRRAPMKRGKPPKRSGRIKPNKKRAAKRLARTHGPEAFGAFTREQACAACGRLYHSDPAHVLGNGGMGRKQDFDTIAPLCGPTIADDYIGCHQLFDRHRSSFNQQFPTFDPSEAARKHFAAWRLAAAELGIDPETGKPNL